MGTGTIPANTIPPTTAEDVQADDGSAASPSISFENDADTGFYRPAADTIGISTGGTERARWVNQGLRLAVDGAAGTPPVSFTGDTDTGFYRPAADTIGISTGGAERARLTSSAVVLNDPNADLDLQVKGTMGDNVLRVDAANERVGVNAGATPAVDFEVGTIPAVEPTATSVFAVSRSDRASIDIITDADDSPASLKINAGSANAAVFRYGAVAGRADIGTFSGPDDFTLQTDGTVRMRIFGSGAIDLSPSGDVRITNGSGTNLPGTSTDGEIRLFDDTDATDPGGRIQFQANSTTFTVNADAGITYTDHVAYAAHHEQDPIGPNETLDYLTDEAFDEGDFAVQYVDQTARGDDHPWDEIHTVPVSLDTALAQSERISELEARIGALEGS